MDKSYVTLEQNVCAVCQIAFNTGAILLDKGLKERFDMHTLTGHSLCPEHQKLADDGYIALVVVSNSQTSSNLKPKDATPTGEFMHIKVEAFKKLFNTEVDTSKVPMVYAEPELLKLIEKDINEHH